MKDMKSNYIIYLLLLVGSLLFPTACSHENIPTDSHHDAEKVHVNIGVRLSGSSNVHSRAFGDQGTGTEGYYEFSDFYVAVFVDVNGVGYLEEFVKATQNPTWDAEDECWNFGVELTSSEHPRRLHFIANYPNLTMGFGEEGQLIGRLLAKGNNHDVYWACRELEKIDDSLTTELQDVPLLRNYAMITLNDARTSTDNFVIDGYALYNVPIRGTVAPYNPSQTNKFAHFVTSAGVCQSYQYMLGTEKYEGNEPFDDGTLLATELVWKNPADVTYMYERSNRTATQPTCMLIKGRFDLGGNITENTPTTYYKLDFVYDDEATQSKVYYNLLRNFIYKMNVNSVTGEGYASVQEALNQPACNNIGGDALAEDYTNISNGTSRLFVSTTSKLFTGSQTYELYYKYITYDENQHDLIISNGSVTVTAPEGNVLSNAASVAASDETTGPHAGWRKVTLNSKAVSGIAQSQDILFAAGGLQRKVELLLRSPYVLSVNTPEEVDRVSGTSLNVDITLPTDLPSSLFPLRLFISSEDNTIYPDYGSNMPAEAQNGKYGFIKEISLDAYESSSSKVFTCPFLTNCSLSATTVHVDNEYFGPEGYDSFANPALTRIEIDKDMLGVVSVELDNDNYPYVLRNNNSTTTVLVEYQDQVLNYITINRNAVTSITDNIIVIENSEGIDLKSELEFTFESTYCTGTSGWWNPSPVYSNSSVTYKATITLMNLLEGGGLDFKHNLIDD